jgi:hypothetical protein
MPITDILILILVTYRVADMLADPTQVGPFNLLLKFRNKVGVRFDEHSAPYGENNFADGLLCIYCNSIWIGIILTLLYMLNIPMIILLPIALSAGAILASRLQ